MTFEPNDLTINQKAVLLTLSKLPPLLRGNRIGFEKVLFLVSKAEPEVLEDIDESFEGYDMGPFSDFVDESLQQLAEYHLADRLSLTSQGEEVAEKLQQDAAIQPVLKTLDTTVNLLREFSVNDLLYMVYNLYPEFAKNSTISEQAQSTRMEHFSIPVTEIPEGRSLTVTSDKGTPLNISRRDGKLVLSTIR